MALIVALYFHGNNLLALLEYEVNLVIALLACRCLLLIAFADLLSGLSKTVASTGKVKENM